MVHSRLAGGESVLLHLETGQYHEPNPTGGMIWELLDGHRGVAVIVLEIRARVEDPPGDFDEIVADFLTQLRERALIA